MTKRRFRLKQIHLFFILLFLLGIIHPMNMEAQTLSKKYPKETLASRMQQISKDYNINIGYRPEQCQFEISELVLTNANIDQALTKSLASTRFAYRKNANNTFVVYEKKEEEKKPATPQQKTSGKGSLSGTVVDERGESIPGVNVIVPQTTNGTITDLDGKYKLDNIPVGVTTIQFSFMSYQTLQVNDVKIAVRETTPLDVVLKEASQELGEVVVTGSVKANTQAGLLALQKISPVMSDGISAQQISKAPDSDVAAALKRITGITTVDNKYVVVRSMGERWNTAAMDGINLPSTEAYNNNFSFDIIPTAMVEGVIVSKTATPDMNANFAGGFVEIKTKDIPQQNFISLSIGGGYNDISTGKDFLTRQRGKYDYLGYDDGSRDFPKNLEPMDWNNPLFFEQSKQFTNDNFTNYRTKAKPNTNFQFSIGRNFTLEGNNRWGFAGAVTVRNEQNILDIDHTARGNWLNTGDYNSKWRDDGIEPVTFYNFKNRGVSYNYNSTVAGMLNFGLQLGKNRISFRNSYTHIYDNTLTMITGWNEYTGGSGRPENAEASYNYFYNGVIPSNDPAQLARMDKPYKDNTSYPIYQTLLQNKLEGNHKTGATELSWFAARTGVSSDTKDYTLHKTYHNFIGNEILAYHQVYNSAENFARGYIENKETDWNYGAAAKWNINTENFKNDIKVGYAGAFKNNSNAQRKFFLRVDENRTGIPSSQINYLMMYGSLAEWFDGSHYTPGGIGWQTKPLYKDAKFEGEVTQHSPYIMLDNRLGDKFRLVWGVRAEYFKYKLISNQIDEADNRAVNREPIEDKPWQWMPSANFTYSPTDIINIRLAYNKAIIRPQFNERTGLPYVDPIANALIYNTSLTSSTINNYDFKFEWFPGLGEILSAGLYYKKIDRPIERVGYISGEGNLYLYNMNSKSAELRGFEVEIRKGLGFLWKDSFLENFFVSGNFVYNKTKVVSFSDVYRTEDGDQTYETDRPLYGQTPWAYNVGINFDGQRLGVSLMYNAKGDQYITVGDDYSAEEIQRPYAVADAQVSYKLLKEKNLEIKFNAKNLFNRVKEYYNNQNSYKDANPNYQPGQSGRESRALIPGATDKYDKGIDDIIFRSRTGRTFSLSVNYTF